MNSQFPYLQSCLNSILYCNLQDIPYSDKYPFLHIRLTQPKMKNRRNFGERGGDQLGKLIFLNKRRLYSQSASSLAMLDRARNLYSSCKNAQRSFLVILCIYTKVDGTALAGQCCSQSPCIMSKWPLHYLHLCVLREGEVMLGNGAVNHILPASEVDEWSKALRSGRSLLIQAWVRIPLLTQFYWQIYLY